MPKLAFGCWFWWEWETAGLGCLCGWCGRFLGLPLAGTGWSLLFLDRACGGAPFVSGVDIEGCFDERVRAGF